MHHYYLCYPYFRRGTGFGGVAGGQVCRDGLRFAAKREESRQKRVLSTLAARTASFFFAFSSLSVPMLAMMDDRMEEAIYFLGNASRLVVSSFPLFYIIFWPYFMLPGDTDKWLRLLFSPGDKKGGG